MAAVLENSLLISFVIGFAIPMVCLIGAATLAQFINYLQYERLKEEVRKEDRE
jgi:hypothetical protein